MVGFEGKASSFVDKSGTLWFFQGADLGVIWFVFGFVEVLLVLLVVAELSERLRLLSERWEIWYFLWVVIVSDLVIIWGSCLWMIV